MFNKKNNSNNYSYNFNPLKSLYEVESFLRKLSCTTNSICLVKNAKKLINNHKKNN